MVKKLCSLLIVSVITVAMIGASALPVSAATKTPGTIIGVKVTNTTDKAVSLTWSKSKIAKKYEVQYKVSSASKWRTKSVTAAKITVSGLKQGTKYSFRIRGVNGKKKGKYSKVITKTTYKQPGKIIGVKATAATNKAISLSWTKSTIATKYEVLYKVSTASSWTTKTVTAAKITISGLKQNTSYNFKVRGINGPVAGAFSAVLTQKTYIMPDAVNGKSIFAKQQTKNEIIIKWAEASNANQYEIRTWQLNTDGPADLQYSDYMEVEENKFVALPEFTSKISLHPNTWYEFKVRSVNSRTGKFPVLRSAWSKPFYACTTTGDRIITAKEENGVRAYEMNGVFVVGVDDVLIPMGTYRHDVYEGEDVLEYTYYDYDYMSVEGVSFPADFKQWDTLSGGFEDSEFAGKTYRVGDKFDGKTIQKITVSLSRDSDNEAPGNYDIAFAYEGGGGTQVTW